MSVVNPFTPEALAAKVLEKLGADALTSDSILRLAAHLAELVNKAPGLHGAEKAALVQQVLRDVIAMPAVRAKLSDDATNTINIVIDTVVPTALTLLISAGRGEFDLKKPRETLFWCCRSAASLAVAVAVASQPQQAHTAPTVTAVTPVTAVAPVTTPEEVLVEVLAPVAAPASSSAPTESTVTSPAEPVAPSLN
jgi:hypothetical protein